MSYNQVVMDNTKRPTIEGSGEKLDRRSFITKGLAVITAATVINTTGLAQNALAQDIQATPISTETKTHLSPDEIMKKHADAIPIGKDEYVSNVLQEEKFVQGRYASKPDNWKAEKATGYFDSQFNSFITGNDNGSLGRFVTRSPDFTSYILAFANDFPLAGELEKEHHIAKYDTIISEQNALQQASRERQEALKRLIALLAENST